MMIHDEMAHAIEQELGLTLGKDFMIAHPLDPVTKEQIGEPYIWEWKRPDIEKPDLKVMAARFHETHHMSYAEKIARETRDYYLAQTDWTDNKTVSQAVHEKYAAYRQALRDITDQPGYPKNIDWPVKPV